MPGTAPHLRCRLTSCHLLALPPASSHLILAGQSKLFITNKIIEPMFRNQIQENVQKVLSNPTGNDKGSVIEAT